jgi:aspartate aminotransferase
VDGMREKTILVSGHSKSYAMTGWRLGYAVLPTPEEAVIFKQLNINIISCTPPFIQAAGKQALDGDENIEIVAAMGREFEKRRDVVVDALNAIDGITCNKPEGAFYVFPNIGGACRKLGIVDFYQSLAPDIKRKTSPSTIFQLFTLYEHGVATMDRPSFGRIGSEGKHYLRLSTATDMDSLKEGVRRIEAATLDKEGCDRFMKAGEHLY